jgi:hypothetical protein
MEPEGSLHYSQSPVTSPYPKPDHSSQSLQIPLPEDPFFSLIRSMFRVLIRCKKFLNEPQ